MPRCSKWELVTSLHTVVRYEYAHLGAERDSDQAKAADGHVDCIVFSDSDDQFGTPNTDVFYHQCAGCIAMAHLAIGRCLESLQTSVVVSKTTMS